MAKKSGDEAPQTIEQLQQRYQSLHKRQIQAQTKLESAQQDLNKLKQQAREEYGTDDIQQLQQRLEQMKKDNEKKRATYQASLDKIEAELTQVEQKYGSTETPDESGAPEEEAS